MAAASNRRKRATPTVADILQRSSDVLVMHIDDVLTKNERHRLIRIGPRAAMKESDLAAQFKAAVALAFAASGMLTIAAGLWPLEVLAIWPTARHHDDLDTANGDSDAPLAMVKDALQAAGLIDDDMRIVADRTWSHYVKGERRTIVRLTRLSAAQHDAGVAPLLALFPSPAAVEPEPKPPRARARKSPVPENMS